MRLFKKILKEALPILILASFGGVIAGIIVNDISIYIAILPGILILAPAVMSLTDAILGMFNSRITSAIHDGDINTESFKNPVLRENILAIIIIITIVSILLGIIAHFACLLLNHPSMGILKFILIALLTNIFSYILMLLLSISVIFLAVKKKKDPDDLIFSISTVFSDISSMFFLLLTIKLVTLL